MYMLTSELTKATEDPSKRLGAVQLITRWGPLAKHDMQEHAGALLGACVPLLAEGDEVVVGEAWSAVNAVALTIPKETQPSFVRVLKVCVRGVGWGWIEYDVCGGCLGGGCWVGDKEKSV